MKFLVIIFLLMGKASFAAPKVTAIPKAEPSIVFDEKESQADFYSVGVPSMLKIHGTTKAVTGSLKKSTTQLSGEFKIQLDTFETGMSLRDKHMKEKTFEVEKYPVATLVLDPILLKDKIDAPIPFTAKLTFHGVEKPISGEVNLKQSDEKTLQYVAKFEIKLTDFKIAPPEFAGMRIQDAVKLEVNGTSTAHSAP